MPTIGERLITPTGDVIEFLETSASTDGARVRTRALLKPEGLRAEPHMHLGQDETYEVILGKLTYRLDGKEHVAEAGSTVVLPRRASHQHYCHGPDDTVVIQSMTLVSISIIYWKVSLDLPAQVLTVPKVCGKGWFGLGK